MIISKGRKSLNCSIPNNLQDFCYINKAQSKNKYQSSYLGKQRHSISTISPITKNKQIEENNFYKSNEKKYNYSINIEPDYNQSYDRHNHIKQPYIMKSIERKRPGPSQKFYLYPQSNQIVNKRDMSYQNTQKIIINNYLQQQNQISYKQRNSYQQINSLKQRNSQKQIISLKQRNSIQKNKQNYLQAQKLRDEFYRTDKLKQYSTNVKNRRALQQQNSRAKYESKYLQKKIKNTQEIIQQKQQTQKKQKQQQKQQNQQPQHNYKMIDRNNSSQTNIRNPNKVRNLPDQVARNNIIQESEQQNRKIHQKISNISKLNEQINARLQRMLLKRYKQ